MVEGVDYSVATLKELELNCVVKKEVVDDLMTMVHAIAGCGGRDRMSYIIDSMMLYLGNNKTVLINDYRTCDVCRDKNLHYELPPLVPIYSSFPFERVVIDFTFMRSINDKDLNTVFSAIDHFTKGVVVHGSVRHPQSQGVVERVQLTVKDIVHSLMVVVCNNV